MRREERAFLLGPSDYYFWFFLREEHKEDHLKRERERVKERDNERERNHRKGEN